MAQDHEIPTDDEVLSELLSQNDGLRPSELVERLQAKEHTYEDIVRAVQRVLDRGKAELRDGGRFVAVVEEEQQAA